MYELSDVMFEFQYSFQKFQTVPHPHYACPLKH
jgi:hypothetical protein